jgi:hypothetical protein
VHRTAAGNENASTHRGGSSRGNVVDYAARSRGRGDRDPVAREKRVKCFFTEAPPGVITISDTNTQVRQLPRPLPRGGGTKMR